MNMPIVEYRCPTCGRWIVRGTQKANDPLPMTGQVWCSKCHAYRNHSECNARSTPTEVSLTADIVYTNTAIIDELRSRPPLTVDDIRKALAHMPLSQLESDIHFIAGGHRVTCAQLTRGDVCNCEFAMRYARLIEHASFIRAALDAAASKAHEIGMAMSSRELLSSLDKMRDGAAKENFRKTALANGRHDGQIGELAASIFKLLVLELKRMGVPGVTAHSCNPSEDPSDG